MRRKVLLLTPDDRPSRPSGSPLCLACDSRLLGVVLEPDPGTDTRASQVGLHHAYEAFHRASTLPSRQLALRRENGVAPIPAWLSYPTTTCRREGLGGCAVVIVHHGQEAVVGSQPSIVV